MTRIHPAPLPPGTTGRAPGDRRRRTFSLALGSGLALAYALLTQLAFRAHWSSNVLGVLSLGFLLGVPCAIGALAVAVADAATRRSRSYALFAGWPACVLLGAATIALSWDAAICLVMALPLLLGSASVGGLCARALLAGARGRRVYAIAVLPLLLPYLITPLERQIAPATSVRQVRNAVTIRAPRAAVWAQVIRVPEIAAAEWQPGWATLAGLPAPREATLAGAGVGAVRHATYADGLAFTERIVAWDEGRHVRFTIVVDRTGPVPAPFGALGGPNLDVLDGAYTLEDGPDGATLLTLESHERLATHFNAYAGWWTDRIMADLQGRILAVVRARCERAARGGATAGRSDQANPPGEVR